MLDAIRTTLAARTPVALIAMSGSLYFSLGLGLTPRDLCWCQRILIYPLVVVLGVAAIEDRPDVWKTVLPLSLGGLTPSVYHPCLQVVPGATCTVGGPCTSIQYSMLRGLLTIPRFAFIGFAFVMAFTVAVARIGDETDDAWGI